MMKISDGTLKEYECATSRDKHFLNEPIALICGHCVCKSCIPKDTVLPIRCNICGKLTNRDIRNDEESILSKKAFQLSINELFSQIEKSFTKSLSHLKEEILNESKINEYLNKLKSEIAARINSLKSELDVLFEEFQQQLNEFKEELNKRKITEFGGNYESKHEAFNESLKKLKEDVQNKQNQNEEKFHVYQNELKDLNKIIHNLGNFYGDIIFVPSKDKFVIDSVGRFVKNEKINQRFKMMLRYPKFRTKNLDVEPHSICVLPNGNLLSCNYDTLSIYDKTFETIKTISKIDSQAICCFFATTDNKERIYFSNSEENQIVMTDLELNKLKSIGTYGKAADQFDYPRGLCFYKNYIFVCDYGNKRLQRLKDTLDYDEIIQFDYNPVQIKISGDVVFIGSLLCLYFYDYNTFTVTFKYEGHNGTISELNSNFYEYYSYNKKFYCYDRNGEFIEEIQTDGCNNSCHNGCLAYFHGLLVISSYEARKLVIIDRHE